MASNITDQALRMDGSCWKFIPVYSQGIWNLQPGEQMFRHPLVLLHVQLALMISFTSFIHIFVKRLHLPRIVSEIMAGIILGPTIVGKYFPSMSQVLFPAYSRGILSTLVKFGFLLFLFLIGVKTDVSLVKRSGAKAWLIGCASSAVPVLVIWLASAYEHDVGEWVRAYRGMLAMTRFPVVVCLLMHLKTINTELGRVALSSSLICEVVDLIGMLVSSVTVALSDASLRVALGTLVFSLIFVLFVAAIIRPIMFWIIKRTPTGKPVKEGYTVFVVLVLMLVSIAGDRIGLEFTFTSIVFGFAIPSGPPLASALVDKLDAVVSGMLIPILPTYCGLKVNLWNLSVETALSAVPVAALGLASKMIVIIVIAYFFKMPIRDSAALAVILCAKGMVELGMLMGFAYDQFNGSAPYDLVVFTIFIMALVTSFLARKLYPSQRYTTYQKRNIQESSNDSEFRILACALRQDDAIAVVKVLEVSNPTRERPLSIYSVYLKQLTGGATPMIINHQLGQKDSSTERWQPIIDVFKYFQLHHAGSSNLHVFSAMSLPTLMHEDICWIAFDKLVSFMVLPFHRRWNIKGEMILNSSNLRNLNINVLEKAPCSVGILVDRRRVLGTSSLFVTSPIYRVAVLYVGGEDDREAMAYARRMAGCPTVRVSVIRFIPEDQGDLNMDGAVIDDEFLRDIHYGIGVYANVMYTEKTVRDCSDTASIIRSIGVGFDLIIAGRRHESKSPVLSGLEEWTELPELGPIGDLLASSDITDAVSVLIVQNQITDCKK